MNNADNQDRFGFVALVDRIHRREETFRQETRRKSAISTFLLITLPPASALGGILVGSRVSQNTMPTLPAPHDAIIVEVPSCADPAVQKVQQDMLDTRFTFRPCNRFVVSEPGPSPK